jgi:hypothetical protein
LALCDATLHQRTDNCRYKADLEQKSVTVLRHAACRLSGCSAFYLRGKSVRGAGVRP